MRSNAIGAMGVLVGMVFVGCGDPTSVELQESLVGSWSWIESTGGIAGVTLTPASTGETLALRFTSGGEVEVVRDGMFERAVSFTTLPGDAAGTLLLSYAEPLFGFSAQTASLSGADTLVLTDGCCDGFVYRFVKAQ